MTIWYPWLTWALGRLCTLPLVGFSVEQRERETVPCAARSRCVTPDTDLSSPLRRISCRKYLVSARKYLFGQDLVSTHNTRAGCIQTDLLRAAAAAPGANVSPHWRELKWIQFSQKSEVALVTCCRFAIIQLQLCEIMRDADLRAGHCTVDTGNLINNIIGRRACSTALLVLYWVLQCRIQDDNQQ